MQRVKYDDDICLDKRQLKHILKVYTTPCIAEDSKGPFGLVGSQNSYHLFLRPDYAGKYMANIIADFDTRDDRPIFGSMQSVERPQWDMRMVRRDGWNYNTYWRDKYDAIKEVILNGTLPVGKRTLLMDEPDRSLDLVAQIQIWGYLENEWSDTFQVVVATHNPMALDIKGANYIDVVPGYLEECRKCLSVERRKDFEFKKKKKKKK